MEVLGEEIPIKICNSTLTACVDVEYEEESGDGWDEPITGGCSYVENVRYFYKDRPVKLNNGLYNYLWDWMESVLAQDGDLPEDIEIDVWINKKEK